MIARRFKIMANLFIRQTGSAYVFSGIKGTRRRDIAIPISQVIAYENLIVPNPHQGNDESWIGMTVTQWVWNKMDLDTVFSPHKIRCHVIVEDERHFGINWDFVIEKRSHKGICLFCETILYSGNRTKDHLVSKYILKDYDFYTKYGLANNLVPCCKNCNGEKESMSVQDFRDYVARKAKGLMFTKRYKQILINLDKILKA